MVHCHLLKAGPWPSCCCISFHCPETTKASDCNEHVNTVIGTMSDRVLFLDKSCFNLFYNMWMQSESLYCSEAQQCYGLGCAIGYNMWSLLLCNQSDLNSSLYIREVLEPEVLLFLQVTPLSIFQQDNGRPHVERIVQVFFEEWWLSLLTWPHVCQICLPLNVSGTWLVGNLFIMILPVTSLDTLWTCIQTVGKLISQEHVQDDFYFMTRQSL